ncbi:MULTISPECIES: SLBB domain-containing protein [Spirulina sp. CCY15215]|uniref:SLBB domain-containing protein n=1 Tax=Spirulina sp. CCY15215 TaxID=2767591 RepID=UPI001951535F|nr:SLBB domain-containing protein [Spirulina major]
MYIYRQYSLKIYYLLLATCSLAIASQSVNAQIPTLEEEFPISPLPSYPAPLPSYPAPLPSYPAPLPSSPAPLPSYPAPVSPPPDRPYTLGSGDRIQMTIFDVDEYNGEYPILIDGTLNLPAIGTVVVQDLTLEEASQKISQRYRSLLVRPIITLGLIAPRPVRLAIAGEVNRPGAYTVNPGGATGFPSVTEVIELAEGITLSANVRQIQIRRTYQGIEQLYAIDLWGLIHQGDLAQDVVLRDGDRVFIPTAEVLDRVESRTISDSTLFPATTTPVQVAVTGEVLRPGTHTVSAEGSNAPPTVTQAIGIAEGITPRADVRNVQLHRIKRTGEEEIMQINLWEILQGGDLEQDIPLQPGDSIIVPPAEEIDLAEIGVLAPATFSPQTIDINVIGEITSPGTQTLRPNTPLNQAILAAGGFNNRARKNKVELVRLNPNGTVLRETIEVDLSQGINDENNPLLLNGDIVVVQPSTLTEVTDVAGAILAPLGSVFSFFNFLNIFGLFR